MRWQGTVVVLAWSALARAGEGTQPPASPPTPTPVAANARTLICIRGTLDCASVVLFEHAVGVRVPIVEPDNGGADTAMDVDFGLLLQVWPRHGLGATYGHHLINGIPGSFVPAVRARYRYWLADEVGLDASAGALFSRRYNGGALQVGIEYVDLLALVASFDLYRDTELGTGTSTTAFEAGISIRFGGYVMLPVLLVSAYALAGATD